MLICSSIAAADLKPNTVAHFYYENIRNFEPPTKDFVVATAQDEKFNVSQFDVREAVRTVRA